MQISELEIIETSIQRKPNAFIGANTIDVSLEEIQQYHIVPSYTKDYEPLISIGDFIQSTYDVVNHYLQGEEISAPSIRVSHPIKGRIPEARHKQASELLEHERTIYYERSMFVIDVPSVTRIIDGQELHLTIGGVKSYHEDNFNSRKGNLEHFKLFVGFQVKVCSNLCVWTDGAKLDLKVRSIGEIMDEGMRLLSGYQPKDHIEELSRLADYSLTEQQFAQILGKARLYNFLPTSQKKTIEPLLFTDTQLTSVARDYYQDESFCRNESGDINLWRVYNLLTGSNKSSYIDQFLSRAVNAHDFTHQIANALDEGNNHWFLN